jgi:multiple sugar transport system permease protein
MTAPAGGAGPVTLARQEQRFALALLAPALLLLLLTTTIPLVYLAGTACSASTSACRGCRASPGWAITQRWVRDPRFWNSLWLTAVYTASTVALQVVIGLSLALLVLQIPEGAGRAAHRRDPAHRAGAGGGRACSGARWCWRPTSAWSTW